MDHPTSEHLNNLYESINWPWVLAATGMMLGWIVWAIRQVFSTRAHTEECRQDVMAAMLDQRKVVLNELKAHEDREEKKMQDHRNNNTQEHAEIRADLRWIRITCLRRTVICNGSLRQTVKG